MDKYRNSSVSLSSSTNRLLNTGPLYTMCGSKSQQQGPKLLMNSNSVGTATKFQFVPARNSSTSFSGPFQFGFTPIFNTVKTFFSNLIKPNVDMDTNSTYNTIEKRKCNSAPNIYMDIMSDRKIGDDFDKNCVVNLTNLEMLAKLSSSTKSFSDYSLPINTTKINSTPKPQQVTNKMDLNYNLEESQPKLTKEVETEPTIPLVIPTQSSVPVPLLQQKCFKMPHVPTKPRTQCRNGKRAKKEKRKPIKSEKNKKESKRHELAFKIHEDVETENETMSTDEWDEPLVIITALTTSKIEPQAKNTTQVATFSKDDFPAMPECKVLDGRNNLIRKQTWELPRLSHGSSSFNGGKQRRISDCDSEDSFIVFDNDDKLTPSSLESNQSTCERIQSLAVSGRQRQISESSEDDFICFEMVASDIDEDDADDDDDSDEMVTSDSDCESEVGVDFSADDEVDASASTPPDSGLADCESEVDDESRRKVRFNLKPVVHVLRTWNFAYRKARRGEWEQYGRDRVRFLDRVKRLESTLVPILDSDHRKKIYCDRYLIQADNDNCNSAIEI